MAKRLYCKTHIIHIILYCLFFIELSKGSGNITHTNKTDTEDTNNLTDTVTLKFKHPEILQQFNNNINKQYAEEGGIRGNRIKVIEDLLENYNNTLTVEEAKPEYIEENSKLKDQYQKLSDEKKILEDKLITVNDTSEIYKKRAEEINVKLESVTTENKELKQQIKELNNKISIKEVTINNQLKEVKEKVVLEEKVKNTTSNIDDLKKKLEENIKKYDTDIAALTTKHDSEITDLKQQLATVNIKYEKLLQDNKEEILTITKQHEEKVEHITAYSFKLKDELSKTKDELNNIKYNYDKYKTSVKNLTFIDRILKRYPEEEDIEDNIKELKPVE